MEFLQKLKLPIIVGIICLLIGRYALSPKQKIVEVIKIVEVEKNVKEEKKKSKTTTRETTKPDGTKVVDTVIDEESGSKETNSRETKIDSSKITTTGSGLTLGLLAIKDIDNFSNTEYGVSAAIPLIGSIKVLGLATTGKQVGVGLGIEF